MATKKSRKTSRAFNVYRGRKLMDTVFFTGYNAEDVRRSLIDHDGYPYDIRVTARRSRKTSHSGTK